MLSLFYTKDKQSKMPKLQQVMERFSLTIPRELVRQKQWKKGQDLFLIYNERGNIEITEVMK